MTEHNWSGWPGAVCLNCGAEDPREVCAAEHEWPACLYCDVGRDPYGDNCKACLGTGVEPGCGKPECEPGACPAVPQS